MDRRYFVAKSGKWRIEISGTPEDAKINFFGQAPRHVQNDIKRFNGSGFRYSFDQLERYAKQFV